LDLSFDSLALERLCNRRAAMAERLGDVGARVLAQCLQELDAADTLATAATLPHLAITHHELDGHALVADPAGNQIVLRLGGVGASTDGDEPWEDATAATITQIINANLRFGA
jgi:hypothetical protein